MINLFVSSFKESLSSLLSPMFLLVLCFMGITFYKKNLGVEKEQRCIIGEKVNSAIELTFSQLTMGIIAGIVGSIMLSLLGIVFDENSSIEIIFIVSFILMFYKSRMVCFAYSGAILGIVSLGVTYLTKAIGVHSPINLNIVTLISFIAVMHFIEGILVVIDGYKGAVPTFKIKGGKIIGGFKLSRQWLLPTVIMVISSNGITHNEVFLSTMSFKLGMLDKGKIAFLLLNSLALYAMVGFKGTTYTISREQKAKESGVIILIYAIILMLIGQISRLGAIFQILSLIIMPVLHELMLKYQIYREKSREYKYISDDGLSVLDVLPTSPFEKIGLKSGDKILSINGFKVKEERDIIRINREYYGVIEIEVKKYNGDIELHNIKLSGFDRLSIVSVPKNVDLLNNNESKFEKVLKKLKAEIEGQNFVNIDNLEIKEKDIDNKVD